MEIVKVFVKTKWKYILTALIAFGIGSTLGPSGDELTAVGAELTAANKEVEAVQNQLEEVVDEKETLIADKNELQSRVDEAETWFKMTDEQKEQAKAAVQKAEEEAIAKKEAEERAKKEAEEQARKEAEEAKSTNTISESKLKTIIQNYSLTNGDKLASSSIINNEIKASIELASDGMFPVEDMAVVTYSQLSDELLNYEGWDVLTVTFYGVGTISMHRSEKETNEYGSYFPTIAIEEKLNY